MSTPIYREREDQNLWNFIFSIFFLIVLVGVVYLIWRARGGFPTSVSWLTLVVMMLATLRLTRLIVYDKITRWFRELFIKKKHSEQEGIEWIELRPFHSGIRRTMYDLLQCPWCISIWSALVIVFCYYVFSWGWVVILFLALSGAGSVLQITANLIGWQAQEHKQNVQTIVSEDVASP